MKTPSASTIKSGFKDMVLQGVPDGYLSPMGPPSDPVSNAVASNKVSNIPHSVFLKEEQKAIFNEKSRQIARNVPKLEERWRDIM